MLSSVLLDLLMESTNESVRMSDETITKMILCFFPTKMEHEAWLDSSDNLFFNGGTTARLQANLIHGMNSARVPIFLGTIILKRFF